MIWRFEKLHEKFNPSLASFYIFRVVYSKYFLQAKLGYPLVQTSPKYIQIIVDLSQLTIFSISMRRNGNI